jgi:hypothetical protein
VFLANLDSLDQFRYRIFLVLALPTMEGWFFGLSVVLRVYLFGTIASHKDHPRNFGYQSHFILFITVIGKTF